MLPAVAQYGAKLLTECRVVRLDADRTRVRPVIWRASAASPGVTKPTSAELAISS